MNKPVQWKVTSFLVGSSDENSAVFCQAKPFIGQEIFPSLIQHFLANKWKTQMNVLSLDEDDAGRALRKSVGHVRFEASDMKENFCQDSFKDFVFLPLFG